MDGNLSPSAPPALRDYYRILSEGPEAFGDGSTLRPLLSERLDFTGAMAGHRPDATESFLQGVSGFIATVGGLDILREVHDESSSAVLYDAAMPGGNVRFAEFFTFDGAGLIATLHVHYDGADYLAKGGR